MQARVSDRGFFRMPLGVTAASGVQDSLECEAEVSSFVGLSFRGFTW